MPRTSGNYSLPPVYLAEVGTEIQPSQHNIPLEDIGQALTESLPRDGSAPLTGNLAMSGNRITGLGNAASGSHAVNLTQAQGLIDDRSLLRDGSNSMTGPIRAISGTLEQPGIQIGNESNGLYWPISMGFPESGPDFIVGGTTIGRLRSGTALPDAVSIVTRGAGDGRYMPLTWTITAGDGMTGGGSGAASRTLSVNSTVVRTSGDQTIGGQKTFSGTANFLGVRIDPNGGSLVFDSDGTVDRSAIFWRRDGVGATSAVILANGDLEFRTAPGRRIRIDGPPILTESRAVLAGIGMTGGGQLSIDRTISMGTPSGITRTSTNSASDTTHSHALTQTVFRDMAVNYIAAGQPGAMLFARNGTGSTVSHGQSVSGANLRPSSEGGFFQGITMAGTWECCGYAPNDYPTLFRRIA